MRTFIALPLPDEVRLRIAELLRELKHILPNHALRFVRPEQMHLTLRFLGEISEQDAAGIPTALSAAIHGIAPLSLIAQGLGTFGALDRPRVVWLGLTGEIDRLNDLQRRVAEATAGLGQTEERAFNAHLTLGRVSPLSGDARAHLIDVVRSYPPRPLANWTADSVEFVRSKLAPGGSRYTTLASIPLVAT